MNDLMIGKKICVVGPSAHLESLNLSDFIDSHDLVIRINRNAMNPDYYGKKTDIIYYNFWPLRKLNNIELKNVKCIVSTYPLGITEKLKYDHVRRNNIPRDGNDVLFLNEQKKNPHIQFVDMSTKFYNNVCRYYRLANDKKLKRPTSGLMCLVDLILNDYQYKSIFITGFTFGKSYAKNYKHSIVDNYNHNIDYDLKAFRYIYNYCISPSRRDLISFDDVCRHILTDPVL